MEIEQQHRIRNKIKEYHKTQDYNIRNDIFKEIMPHMQKWIKSIIVKWNKFEPEDELLSLTWDCYYFCLEKYHNFDIPIPKHFFNYTRYYLLNRYAIKERVLVPLDELKEILGIEKTKESQMFVNFLTLYQFREGLPKEFHVVWDDALLSLSDAPKERHITKNHGMDNNAYTKLKKSYVVFIKVILGLN